MTQSRFWKALISQRKCEFVASVGRWGKAIQRHYPGIPTAIQTIGVNITTIAYLRVLIVGIGSTIILMVVEAQGLQICQNTMTTTGCQSILWLFFSNWKHLLASLNLRHSFPKAALKLPFPLNHDLLTNLHNKVLGLEGCFQEIGFSEVWVWKQWWAEGELG